jgi:hypothetical protein
VDVESKADFRAAQRATHNRCLTLCWVPRHDPLGVGYHRDATTDAIKLKTFSENGNATVSVGPLTDDGLYRQFVTVHKGGVLVTVYFANGSKMNIFLLTHDSINEDEAVRTRATLRNIRLIGRTIVRAQDAGIDGPVTTSTVRQAVRWLVSNSRGATEDEQAQMLLQALQLVAELVNKHGADQLHARWNELVDMAKAFDWDAIRGRLDVCASEEPPQISLLIRLAKWFVVPRA